MSIGIEAPYVGMLTFMSFRRRKYMIRIVVIYDNIDLTSIKDKIDKWSDLTTYSEKG